MSGWSRPHSGRLLPFFDLFCPNSERQFLVPKLVFQGFELRGQCGLVQRRRRLPKERRACPHEQDCQKADEPCQSYRPCAYPKGGQIHLAGRAGFAHDHNRVTRPLPGLRHRDRGKILIGETRFRRGSGTLCPCCQPGPYFSNLCHDNYLPERSEGISPVALL